MIGFQLGVILFQPFGASKSFIKIRMEKQNDKLIKKGSCNWSRNLFNFLSSLFAH